MLIVPVITMIASIVMWLVTIRPYAIKNHAGFTTGTSAGITMWVDWQQASDIAREKADAPMLRLCRIFLAMQILMIASFLISIFSPV